MGESLGFNFRKRIWGFRCTGYIITVRGEGGMGFIYPILLARVQRNGIKRKELMAGTRTDSSSTTVPKC